MRAEAEGAEKYRVKAAGAQESEQLSLLFLTQYGKAAILTRLRHPPSAQAQSQVDCVRSAARIRVPAARTCTLGAKFPINLCSRLLSG